MSPNWRRTTLRSFKLHRTWTTKTVHITLPISTIRPLEDMLKHYTDTLCSQKQTNFATSLLQDIPIFTGHYTTLREDWLMNIETVTDLTLEGRTNLSQAKSKGLACTLITEAITSGKSWDDIKDLLQLKICNFDITHLYPISWRFNKGRRNLSPHTYIILKERPRDVIL